MIRPDKPTEFLPLVQALRGFAALCVVMTHILLETGLISDLVTLSGHPSLGEFGVDIFFVISGFIMVVVSQNAFARPGAPGLFLRKRIARIVPLYWLLSGLLMAVIIIAPGLVEHPVIDATYWVKSLLFIPAEHPVEGGLRPVLVVGWTLQFEMFFYFLFAIALLFPRNRGLPLLLTALGVICVSGLVFAPQNNVLEFFSKLILVEFVAGVVIGWLYVSAFRLPAVALLPSLILSLILVIAGWRLSYLVDLERVIFFGLPAALMVGGITLAQGAGRKSTSAIWQNLGDSSYALYLSHIFVIAALAKLADSAGRPLWREDIFMVGGFILVSAGLCCVVGWWIHGMIERPATQYFGNLMTINGGRSGLSRQPTTS